MRNVLLCLALFECLSAGAASAQSAEPATPDKLQQLFAKADQNKDGMITLDEWKAAGRRERGFRLIDANHDGKMTLEELRGAAAAYGGRG